MKNLYFDYCSSTPLLESVQTVMLDAYQKVYGNPSSTHRLGKEAGDLVEKSREKAASILGVECNEVIFTSGATESNNLALFGTVKAARKKSGNPVHVITSSIEHSSVFESTIQLRSEQVEVTYLPVDRFGVVQIKDFQNAIRKNTVLVSLIHVNNETGTVQPVDEIGAILKTEAPQAYFHVDGVQAFGKVEVDLSHIDMYTLSGHKIGAPKGIGILVVKNHVDLAPIQYGGKQEGRLRPGTINVPGVAALAEAMMITDSERAANIKRLKSLQIQLRNRLEDNEGIIINSSSGHSGAPHIFNFSYPKSTSALMLNFLEKKGLHLSSQSACSSKGNKVSRVIMEMSHDEKISSSSIRIGLSRDHCKEDVEYLLECILEMKRSINEKKFFYAF